MERTILHVDMNNFYASVECAFDPTLKNKPVAVCGDVEARHGIVLAKNMLAKACGVSTGDAVWEAKLKCPELQIVSPHFDRYFAYSERAKAIYAEYTDMIESFGIDECWLDVTASRMVFGTGREIAEEIRRRIKEELGVTVSVGVSYNKTFAKMGSDYKKPDAVTEITRENFRELLWGLDVSALLGVGRSTKVRLSYAKIDTVGALAGSEADLLSYLLGKNGITLWRCANGIDESPVIPNELAEPIKSISNSTTTPRDMMNENDISVTLRAVCQNVASRLREERKKCSVICLYVKYSDLTRLERQCRNLPTYLEGEIWSAAVALYQKNCTPGRPVRSIGVSVTGLCDDADEQLSFFDGETTKRAKLERLSFVIDSLRERYGKNSVRTAILLAIPDLVLSVGEGKSNFS